MFRQKKEAPKQAEKPKSNGVIVTKHPPSATYEFYRNDVRIGHFRQYGNAWRYISVGARMDRIDLGLGHYYDGSLTADETAKILNQLTILNEQDSSTKE